MWGVADEDTNPLNWSLAGGVGGRGLIPGREEDVFGIGYFYNDLQQGDVVDRTLDLRSAEQGFEIFYEAQVTGWLHVTPDLQVNVSPAIREEFENGRNYYAYDNKSLIQIPFRTTDHPEAAYLEWHNEHVFIS